MISIITIVLFFIYTWGFGFTVTYFLKKSDNFYEREIMNIGIGLGVFSILSIILNTLRIPLDWRIFLILSILCPLYHIYKHKKIQSPSFIVTRYNFIIFLVFLIFSVSFYMYLKGAFAYPYLEDEDPWGHTVGMKYVAIEKTAFDPIFNQITRNDEVLSYIDPYPPAYDIIFGILHQTSEDLRWTVKFFNSLIIAMSILFFFFFTKQFSKNNQKAILATFFLAAVPAYLSHFIWAHTLVITLFFPTMYAFILIHDDKKWLYIAAIMVGAIWVSQNLSQPIKITTMVLLYLIIFSITHKKIFVNGFIALFSGMILSFFWWGAILTKYGWNGFVGIWQSQLVTTAASSTPFFLRIFKKIFSIIKSITNTIGSGSRAYTFDDFFYAKTQNMINNPIGIGIVLSILCSIGVIFLLFYFKSSIVKKENNYRVVSLFWLIFTFWGVNGVTFPVSIARGPFRVWMLLVIPLSIIAVEGVYFLKSLFKSKLLKKTLITLIIIGVIFTSFTYKYQHNTTIWPTSGVLGGSPQTAFEYANWFDSQNVNTKVFMYSKNKLVIGFGKDNCAWCEDEIIFSQNIEQSSPSEIHEFLKSKNYEFLFLSFSSDLKFFKQIGGEENLEQRLQNHYKSLIDSQLFIPVYQKEGLFLVLKIK